MGIFFPCLTSIIYPFNLGVSSNIFQSVLFSPHGTNIAVKKNLKRKSIFCRIL